MWRSLLAHLWERCRQIDIVHGQGANYTQSIMSPLSLLLGKPSLVKASLTNDDFSSLSGSHVAPIQRVFLGMLDAYVAISANLEQEFA